MRRIISIITCLLLAFTMGFAFVGCGGASDKKADTVEVVKFENGSEYWDPDMAWAKDAGAGMEPPLDDALGEEVYCDESTLPYGERYLSSGLVGLGGTNDFSNQKDITYYNDTDFFNMLSSETLTILPGYKTYLQPDGWSCGCCSALCMLEWYGKGADLNHLDLGMLRESPELEMGTELAFAKNIFKNLTKLGITDKWEVTTSDDDPEKLHDSEWVQKQLKAGHPIMVMWNSSGWHWQTIIGYDNMGTKDNTQDDVIILADPYDTTDHNQDGYFVDGFERLAYGWYSSFEDKLKHNDFIAAFPAKGHEKVIEALGAGNN